jgi:hypothetical protein
MVRGKVVDTTGAPIAGAVLSVDRTSVRTQATAAGNYILVGVPVGTRTIRAQIIGFTPTTVDVTVRANETITQDLTVPRPQTGPCLGWRSCSLTSR